MARTKKSGKTAGARQYYDYNRKRLRVACIRLGTNQNSSVLQEIYDRLDDWDEDNAPDVAHNHVPEVDLAKEITDPKNEYRRKDMAMAYLQTEADGASEDEEEGEEMGEGDGDHDQEQHSEGDTDTFDADLRVSSPSARRPQNIRTRRTVSNKNGVVPAKSSSRKTPKPQKMTGQDLKGKGKQKQTTDEEEEDEQDLYDANDNETNHADIDHSPRVRPFGRPDEYDGVQLPGNFAYKTWSTKALRAALKHAARTRNSQTHSNGARGKAMPVAEFRALLIERLKDHDEEWLRRLNAGEVTVSDEEARDLEIMDAEEFEISPRL
jgi:hypothetical protein